MTYTPTYISGMSTGLVQGREEPILPNDAYPVLENAFVWRERIKRKKGVQTLGRLQRIISVFAIGAFGAGPTPTYSNNLFTLAGIVDPAASVSAGTVSLSALGYTWEDSNFDGRLITTLASPGGYNGNITGITIGTPTVIDFVTGGATFNAGDVVYLNSINGTTELNGKYWTVLSEVAGVSVTIDATTENEWISGGTLQMSPGNVNYISGDVSMQVNAGFAAAPISGEFAYNPNLPVMGILTEELNNENAEQTVFFDQTYAYIYTTQFQEFIPGTTWTGTDYNFFWGTNYWVTPASSPPAPPNKKLFWVTNYSGVSGDPIRYTDGTVWVDFAPTINAAGDKLNQCLAMLPFRGRMVVFRTLEGQSLFTSTEYFQRIRWAAIGNPISDIDANLFPAAGDVNANAWRDDIRGQGGFLDIPTSQAIMSVGFVRDNLVIYCERSTWQLRYTGRSIQPFQIERVNAELGTESTFSAIQFDTSLVGIGDKGIVQCDSFKSERIDIKIPDLVFEFKNAENGNKRIQGIRNFDQKLAYWTYPYAQTTDASAKFPNRRLVYNYENDSWAIFTDSFTALGNFQAAEATRWQDVREAWEDCEFPWVVKPALFPDIVSGNQQGYVFILDQFVTNQESLLVSDIVGNDPNVTTVTSINHNLETGQVIDFVFLAPNFDWDQLLLYSWMIVRIDADTFNIYRYNSDTGEFDIPDITDNAVPFLGSAQIKIRDNFIIRSKKFNYLNEGQNMQLGYVDILLDSTDSGAITMNVYADYNQTNPMNTAPNNQNPSTNQPDTFFNSVVPTSSVVQRGSDRNWQRVFCNERASFITTEYTFSNAQMAGNEQKQDVEIHSQIMWTRKAGKQLPIGV